MAWINNENFDILQTLKEKHNVNDYFEVDDMIALPVAELNRRGYFTVNSCAGHPFQTETILDTRVSQREFTIEELFDELFEDPDADDAILTFRTFASQRSYIVFEEPLPDTVGVPDGWRYDAKNQAIYRHYTHTPNPYLFMKAQMEFMLSLVRWITKLPYKRF